MVRKNLDIGSVNSLAKRGNLCRLLCSPHLRPVLSRLLIVYATTGCKVEMAVKLALRLNCYLGVHVQAYHGSKEASERG